MKITYYEAVNNNLQVRYNPEQNLLTLYLNGQKHYYAWDPETGEIHHLDAGSSYTREDIIRELYREYDGVEYDGE